MNNTKKLILLVTAMSSLAKASESTVETIKPVAGLLSCMWQSCNWDAVTAGFSGYVAQPMTKGWLAVKNDERVQSVVNYVGNQLQEHPNRSAAIAGAVVGLVLVSIDYTMKTKPSAQDLCVDLGCSIKEFENSDSDNDDMLIQEIEQKVQAFVKQGGNIDEVIDVDTVIRIFQEKDCDDIVEDLFDFIDETQRTSFTILEFMMYRAELDWAKILIKYGAKVSLEMVNVFHNEGYSDHKIVYGNGYHAAWNEIKNNGNYEYCPYKNYKPIERNW